MTTAAQRSFAAGEIAPSMYARVDQVKYATGLRTCKNFVVMRHGGVTNRAGTTFVGEVKDSSKVVRLMPFVFNAAQTYVIEIGDLYMRFHKDGAPILETAETITGVTQADPAVVTIAGHPYVDGEEVYISGVIGMTELNGRTFKIANAGVNTFELQTMDGTNLDATGYTAYSSAGEAERVYTITTPYVEADVNALELQYVQSADVITVTHPTYKPRELARTGDTSWTLTAITFAPGTDQPDGGAATGAGGAESYRYRVTAVADETYEESLPGYGTTTAITAATQANPVVITAVGHPYSNGDEVYITGVVGMTEINDLRFTVSAVGGNNFSLSGVDGTGYTAYVSGGTVARTYIRVDSVTAPATNDHTVTWTAVTDAVEYNVYFMENGIYGYIGTAGTNTFVNDGVDPDLSDTPPTARDPFDSVDNYPSTATYYQQRRIFSNTNNDPEKTWASRSGYFTNFTISFPIQDDDAVTFTLVGRQVNAIRHLLELGTLVALTDGAEWSVAGDEAGILKPTGVNAKQHSYNGSSGLRPIMVNGSAIYVQSRGGIVRDLVFDFEVDGYRGNDLTLFSSHLLEGYTIADWAYQQIPHSVVWMVRSGGTLLGLTYVREHQLLGWHQHVFAGGTVENVCTVPEGTETALYLVINRTIDGKTVRYVERMETRVVSDIEDSIFMDSALSYDGTNADTSHNMTLSGGVTWDFDETLTLTSSAAYFAATDVGNEIHLTGSDGTLIRFTIDAYTNTTVVTGRPNKIVPVAMRTVATATWGKAIDSVSGLWHLEGEAVSVFGDGNVVASPNNPSYDSITVADGTAALDQPYVVIHVGLPITAEIETLDIDTSEGETMADKAKNITAVTLFVESTRGLWAGSEAPPDDATDPLEGLTEFKLRSTESYDDPNALQTGSIEVNVRGEWNSNGRIFIRQVDPIPASILAAMPAGEIPLTGG